MGVDYRKERGKSESEFINKESRERGDHHKNNESFHQFSLALGSDQVTRMLV